MTELAGIVVIAVLGLVVGYNMMRPVRVPHRFWHRDLEPWRAEAIAKQRRDATSVEQLMLLHQAFAFSGYYGPRADAEFAALSEEIHRRLKAPHD